MKWYLVNGQQELGPFTSDQLRQLVQSNKLRSEDLLRPETDSRLFRAGDTTLFPHEPMRDSTGQITNGSFRPINIETGFQPASYGSFRPSDGYLEGIKRVLRSLFEPKTDDGSPPPHSSPPSKPSTPRQDSKSSPRNSWLAVASVIFGSMLLCCCGLGNIGSTSAGSEAFLIWPSTWGFIICFLVTIVVVKRLDAWGSVDYFQLAIVQIAFLIGAFFIACILFALSAVVIEPEKNLWIVRWTMLLMYIAINAVFVQREKRRRREAEAWMASFNAQNEERFRATKRCPFCHADEAKVLVNEQILGSEQRLETRIQTTVHEVPNPNLGMINPTDVVKVPDYRAYVPAFSHVPTQLVITYEHRRSNWRCKACNRQWHEDAAVEKA